MKNRKTIHLITLASVLHDSAVVEQAHAGFIAELKRAFDVCWVTPEHIGDLTADDFSVLFVATGGVEQAVTRMGGVLPQKAVLVADGLQNSLAASLEISAWLRAQGRQSEIVHGPVAEMVQRLEALHADFQALRRLAAMRVGVVGKPSSWLIASGVDYAVAKSRWGMEMVDVSLSRLCEYFEQTSDSEAGSVAGRILRDTCSQKEATGDDVLKAARMYLALRRIVEEEKLDALTLSCFDLIGATATTGCLALALLNDEGIVAGCEGDLRTLFTMCVVKAVTAKPSFMANPSMVDSRTNEFVFAHCTVGIRQTERFSLRSHFESGISVGIQGYLPLGEVTVVKCGGDRLDEYFVASGELLENTDFVNMCRTQVRVRLHASAGYFLHSPLGNHHVLLCGNHAERLKGFLSANGCMPI